VDRIFQIVRGIPTGTNAAPEITNLYLFYYELAFFQLHLPNWATLPEKLQLFLLSWKRYIDDCLHIAKGDTSEFLYLPSGIYPAKLTDPKTGKVINLPLELSGETGESVNFLDVTLTLKSKPFTAAQIDFKLYDKREHLVVNGTRLSTLRNFPHIDSKLADVCKYGVVKSQLHRFARRFTKASLFQKEVMKFANKLIKEGYIPSKIIRKIITFRGWRPTLGRWPSVLRRILMEFKRMRKLG
jgi:hypothetical protein